MRGRIFIVVALLIAGLLLWNYLRATPAVAASQSLAAQKVVEGTAPTLPWPSTGSAAVGVSSLGLIGTSGNEQPVPMASVAKVMTALVVLADKPLNGSDSGPSITITDIDVQAYQADLAQKQSVVAVQAGEQLTETQALEAMLIPSGNNIAETLARWDAGTIPAFVAKMNKRAKDLGLARTKFADPAGVSPDGASVPSELMRMGMAAMKQLAFRNIVRQPQVQLPVAGVVYNVDSVLGQDGIVGIKTGSGLSTGANFLFAAGVIVNGFPLTIFGCVMGQPTLAAAFSAAEALISAVKPALIVNKVLVKNQTVGGYDSAWSEHSDILSTTDVDLVEWPGMVLRQRLDAPALTVDNPLPAGTQAGTLHIVLGDYNIPVPLVTASPLFPAGRFWRITRLPWTNS
jgi:D-alanyl-D-alanine carboxypeptidase (penicillin-binding protein 5/6)